MDILKLGDILDDPLFQSVLLQEYQLWRKIGEPPREYREPQLLNHRPGLKVYIMPVLIGSNFSKTKKYLSDHIGQYISDAHILIMPPDTDFKAIEKGYQDTVVCSVSILRSINNKSGIWVHGNGVIHDSKKCHMITIANPFYSFFNYGECDRVTLNIEVDVNYDIIEK